MGIFGEVFTWFGESANWVGDNGILPRTVQHLGLTALAVVIACLVALPVALWLGHIGKGGAVAINISNVGRAVPTFAVLVLLALTTLGFGTRPTIVALVLFAIPPVLTNAYVGMREVDRDTVEAARGMGMTGWQLLRQVELPLAFPLIMTGIRLCAVQVLATATIAALVAGPGLGRIITAGYTRADTAQVIGGAIAVALLALVVEVGFEVAQRTLDPVARARGRGRRPVPVPVPLGTGPLTP
jgi:osmoprotectant transport system permease protein